MDLPIDASQNGTRIDLTKLNINQRIKQIDQI